MRRKHGFSMIELLTVLAVSTILLAIIAIPMIQGFNLTRAAQGFADAQERARSLVDQITREVSNSVAVRDPSGDGGRVVVVVPSDPDWNGTINSFQPVTLEYAKIDLYQPAAGEPLLGPNGALLNPDALIDPNGDATDPDNWREDPTLRTPRGQVVLPAAEGLKLVRFFVGLNRPLALAIDGDGADLAALSAAQQTGLVFRARYENPYDGLLSARSGRRDNLFVLRRAEIELRLRDNATGNWVVNPLLDLNGDGTLQKEEIDDPDFFVPDGTAAKAQRILGWVTRSRIVTEISRYDMIQPIFDRSTRRVQYDGNVPRVLPLIEFAPARVSAETVERSTALRAGEETDNGAKVGPEVYRTEFGGYANTFVRLWPSNFFQAGSANPNLPWDVFQAWPAGSPYHVQRDRFIAGVSQGLTQVLVADETQERNGGVEVFDVDAYRASKSFTTGLPFPTFNPALTPAEQQVFRYPFSFAVARANTRSGWLSNATARRDFVPVVPEMRAGKVVAGFSIQEVGTGTVNYGANEDNRPRSATGPDLLPNLDNTIGAPSATRWQQASFSPSSTTSQINQRFNVIWNDWNQIMPLASGLPILDRARYAERFIDLRFANTDDGAVSPLHPTEGFPRARIVPGSEVVFGPDQNRGPNRGQLVRYVRTTDAENVGPNEYFIQYVNQREPNYTTLGFTGVPANIYDPTFYDATSVVSALVQPRYRAGYLKFNSSESQPIPQGNIFVSYRFQFNEPNDVISVDYDSTQKINVSLTVRNFAQTTSPNPQNVTVRAEAAVRNFSR